MPTPTETTAPLGSQIAGRVPGAYFHDAWSIEAAEPDLDALGQFLRVVRGTPRWIEVLMALRNRVVALVGLKNLGGMAGVEATKGSADYQVGDRVGIFTLRAKTENEALLGDDDKHLNVVVSVHKHPPDGDGPVRVTVTTVVHVHNWLGRLYMVPVAPMHRLIAQRMVQAVGHAG